MRDLPVLFSAPMVRVMLDGRKAASIEPEAFHFGDLRAKAGTDRQA